MAAILIKIGALTLKTLAKPLSSHFTQYVMNHSTLRAYVIGAAQVPHSHILVDTQTPLTPDRPNYYPSMHDDVILHVLYLGTGLGGHLYP